MSKHRPGDKMTAFIHCGEAHTESQSSLRRARRRNEQGHTIHKQQVINKNIVFQSARADLLYSSAKTKDGILPQVGVNSVNVNLRFGSLRCFHLWDSLSSCLRSSICTRRRSAVPRRRPAVREKRRATRGKGTSAA